MASLPRPAQVRAFSGFQTEMEKFDFTDKMNVQELGLQSPDQKQKMNLFTAI